MPRLVGRLIQLLWLAGAILGIGLALAGLRPRFTELQLVCHTPRCVPGQATQEIVADYERFGYPVDAAEFEAHALTTIAYSIVMAVFALALSGVLIAHKPTNLTAVLTAFVFLLLALALSELPEALARAYPAYEGFTRWLRFSLLTGLFIVFNRLPNGGFHWAGLRWIEFAFVAITFYFVVLQGITLAMPLAEDNALFGGLVMMAIGLTLASLVARLRAAAEETTRQQLQWILVGVGLALSWLAFTHLLYFLAPVFSRGHWAGYLTTIDSIIIMAFVGCVAVAVLQFQLFDIEILLNRGLVYGILTVCVVGIYAFIVSGLSVALATLTPADDAAVKLILPLIATALVAIAFQPLRERLQRWVNRLMYGERDEPYAVLARLGQRLEATLAPQAVLPTLVETVATALRLPYAAIQLTDGTAAVQGSLPAHTALETFPLVYQAETLGQLAVAPRAPTEAFIPAERRLLADIAHQAGVAAYAVRLTAELQRSRERLVTTREEERRRLRRDLHDGLGPQLAALNLQVGAVRQALHADPAKAEQITTEMRADIHAAISNVRRVVYGLRPPALDELGLLGTMRGHIEQLNTALPVHFHAPANLPPLPAAVEVAAYRIIQEALTNVIKHAQAQSCTVTVQLKENLWVQIADDGVGLPAERHTGVGLHSMRERAEELGGSFTIAANPPRGTLVSVTLPIPNP